MKPVREFNNDTEIDGIKVNIGLTEGNDNKSVIVKYSLTNVSGKNQTFKIGTYADNRLAENDDAAIYKDGHSKIVVTQDDKSTRFLESYGTQFSITFSPEVSTSWLGLYEASIDYSENVFVDGDVLSYTVDDNADSEFTYSWGGSLKAGESKTYTATFRANKAESSTIKFYKYGETNPVTKDALVGGSVKTETVHEEENYVYEWNTKQDGTGNYYPSNRSILVTEKEMNLYELKYDKNHNIVLGNNNDVTITNENGNVVAHHGTIKYNLTPKEGYKIVSVMVNGIEKISELKNNVLTLNDVMGDVNINVKAVPDYKLTNGSNQKYVVNKDNKLTFKINAKYDTFANDGKIYIDNTLVNEKNYSFAKDNDGRVVFTLNKKYLDTLSNGSHTIKFVFGNEGKTITTFTIQKNNTLIENPETSDNIAFYIATSILSMIGLVGTNTFRRKQLNN